uniref:Uncharacterized protein n=1 Tax=Tanacetum cinerariifolium TaxID=118510 RepID=A0A6L2NXQ8_TANCI|nr:hypothetical protein [Tanacetum cinerariifolium]
MVNTRTNPDTTTSDNTHTLTAIQTAIEQINGSINGLLLFQQFATRELNRLNGEEGMSNIGGSGLQYGRLTKFEFPKFYGEDVQGWLYRVNQLFLIDSIPVSKKQTPLLTTPRTPYATTSYANKTMSYPPKSTTTTLALPAPNTISKLVYVQPIKKLTQKEIADKRAKNLCFYCDEKFIPGHKLHSLIDSGSTHIFLDLKVAKKLGCKLKATCLMDVSVANGQVMSSLYECKGFTWTLQGVEFTSDVFILPLGGCELVLGVQWLSILGDIKWNFKDLIMDFVYNYRRMVLRGTQKAALQRFSGKRQSKEISNGQVLCVYPNTMFSMSQTTTSPLCSQITELLHSYQDVFVTPTSLPPKRKQDHRIPLVPNTTPVNIRPYKHPPNQKDAVEAMVQELMASGVIRDSQSPYSSPIVMIKKKDGYHQIRMHEEDIEKTAFRIHEGYYEFLHLQLVLQAMRQNSLYAKMSKCNFAAKQVEYLGHIISGEGVSIDPSKIIAMQKWPTSVTLKQLRGFLRLTGYYKRFIKNYASISKPLTLLLKKKSFAWNFSAQASFEALKVSLSQALVLALPNFNKPFIVETDASGMGIGAVLQHGGHPIAYLNKSLSRKHQTLSTYEKEFYARLTTPFQAKWLPNLLGYDYEISCKHGSKNHATDALSRISNGSKLCSLVLSTVTSDWLKQIKHSWEIDVDLQLLIKQLTDHTYAGNKYTWTNAELRRKGNLVVGNDDQLKQSLVTYFHSNPVGGHSGIQVTVKKLGIVLYWRGMKKLVKKFVAECDVCQRNKPDLSAYPGPLQPLPIPTKVWHDISIDFIEALPPSQARTSSLEEVDKTMQAREQAIAMLQFHLKRSQNRIKSMADKNRSDRNFKVGMKVYLKLQPYRQSTVRQGTHHKFAAKYYGPSVVIAKVGKVAYKLQLPPDSQIHPVFDVSQLKLWKGTNHQVGVLPLCGPDGVLSVEPEAIIGRRLGKLNNKAILYVLVKWVNQTEEEAIWKLYTDLLQRVRFNNTNRALISNNLEIQDREISEEFLRKLPSRWWSKLFQLWTAPIMELYVSSNFVVADALANADVAALRQFSEELFTDLPILDFQVVADKCPVCVVESDPDFVTALNHILETHSDLLLGDEVTLDDVPATGHHITTDGRLSYEVASLEWLKRAVYCFYCSVIARTVPDKVMIESRPEELDAGGNVELGEEEERQRRVEFDKMAAMLNQLRELRFREDVLLFNDAAEADREFDVLLQLNSLGNWNTQVFHVSQFKLCKGTNHQVGVLPLCGPDGVLSVEPEAIIGRRLGKLNNKVVLYVLVKLKKRLLGSFTLICFKGMDYAQKLQKSAKNQTISTQDQKPQRKARSGNSFSSNNLTLKFNLSKILSLRTISAQRSKSNPSKVKCQSPGTNCANFPKFIRMIEVAKLPKFKKLLKDFKELVEYDQSTRTDRPIFLNDNEDHPVQNRESPENSSEENVISKTNQEPPQDSNMHQLIDECCKKFPEEQKQNMEKTMFDLVKIIHRKQFLCIHDDVDDLIESALDSKLLSINSINSQRLDKKEQEVKIVEEQPAERRNQGDIRFLKKLLIDDSILSHESSDDNFEENPLIPRPPPEPPDDNFDLEPEVISAVMEEIDEPDEHFNPGREIFVSTNNEDVDYFPFMFVIRFFLSYLILSEISPLLLSAESEDTIFDPGLLESINDESFDKCESCISGKITKKPFNNNIERASDLLGLIHTDMCGPLRHVSRKGASYFLTFTDDFSRYGYVYLLKHKHEQNGVSERRNRTLLDMVRSMFNLTTLPLSFWDYALESAVRYPKETMGYYFYFSPENKVIVARYGNFLERDLISQKFSARDNDLEDDHMDTLPSENTSEILAELESLGSPPELIHVRRFERTTRAPNRLCLNIEVEDDEVGDLGEPANYKAAMLDPDKVIWQGAMDEEMNSMKVMKV